ALVVAPGGQGLHHRAQRAGQRRPPEEAQQARRRRLERVVSEEQGDDLSRERGVPGELRRQRGHLARDRLGERLRLEGPEDALERDHRGREVHRRVRAGEQRDPGLEVVAVALQGRRRDLGEPAPGDGVVDARAEAGDGPEVRMVLEPALGERTGQCPWPASRFGSTGTQRAPRPKRKTVAAMSPMETAHSTNDGAYRSAATQGMRPRRSMAKMTTLMRLWTTPSTARAEASSRTSGRARSAALESRTSGTTPPSTISAAKAGPSRPENAPASCPRSARSPNRNAR